MLHIFYPEAGHLEKLTWAVIIGVIVTLVGISIIGVAGNMKAAQLSDEEKKAAVKDFNFPKGITIALLAGFMSACFNVGLEFGSSLHFENTPDIFKTLPATLLVTLGGFVTSRLLLLSEQQEPYLGRLRKDVALPQQPVVLCPGRCLVVQPVLRAEPRKGLPHRFARAYHVCFLHIDGAQCRILQRVGNHSQRVERLLPQDHRCAGTGYHCAYCLDLHSRTA